MNVDGRGRDASRRARSAIERIDVPTVATVVGRRRRQRRGQIVGGSSAAAFVVVVSLLIVVSATRSPDTRGLRLSNPLATSTTDNAQHPIASADAPAAGFLSAPIGTDVHTLKVWDWNGEPLRTIHTKAEASCCGGGILSPDGTKLLLYGHFGEGDSWGARVFDSEDRVIADGPDVGGTWADDSQHMCALQSHDANQPFGPSDLVLTDLGHGERIVAQVPSSGPDTSPEILRCSVADDEAVVVTDLFPKENISTVVRLSTGQVTTPIWATTPRDAQVIAISGDGRYVLQELISKTYDVTGEIIDAESGKVVDHVDGMPSAISWDGHLVVTSGQSGFDVVDWRTGAVVWRTPQSKKGSSSVDAAIDDVTVRPASDDLALTVSNDPGPEHRTASLWLVTPTAPPRMLSDAVSARLFM